MTRTLFALAGPAALGWLLIIILPGWRFTRRVACSGIFPAFLAALYLGGVVPLLARTGLGVVRDFGTAEGVIRLLADPDVALIAWIHILAFDQVVGLYIYRENMRDRVLPLPLQSLVLFVTFMFGPIGYLAYFVARYVRRGNAPGGSMDAAGPTPRPPAASPPAGLPLWRALPLWDREDRGLVALGALGVVLGIALFATMAVHGRLIAPEGDLYRTASFELAVGIYALTLAAILPLAGLTEKGRRRWRNIQLGQLAAAYLCEIVPVLRGYDPRFSKVSSPPWQLLGLLFFLLALLLIPLFVILFRRFFRDDVLPDRPALRLALRYAAVSAAFGFGSGLWMSAINSNHVGGANVLPMHALGFHGLQALPILGWLLARAGGKVERQLQMVHAAGLCWIGASFFVLLNTALGMAPGATSFHNGAAALLLAVFGLIFLGAAMLWLRQPKQAAPRGAALV
jgi:hypothetical protein